MKAIEEMVDRFNKEIQAGTPVEDLVPAPEVVHERLQKVLAEAAFLRRLLRLSVRAKKLREQ